MPAIQRIRTHQQQITKTSIYSPDEKRRKKKKTYRKLIENLKYAIVLKFELKIIFHSINLSLEKFGRSFSFLSLALLVVLKLAHWAVETQKEIINGWKILFMGKIKWIQYWNLFSFNVMPSKYIRFVFAWAQKHTHTYSSSAECIMFFYLWPLFCTLSSHGLRQIHKVIPKHYRVHVQCRAAQRRILLLYKSFRREERKKNSVYTTNWIVVRSRWTQTVSFNLFMNNDIKYLFFEIHSTFV